MFFPQFDHNRNQADIVWFNEDLVGKISPSNCFFLFERKKNTLMGKEISNLKKK